jgi:glycosyltransferase involved in cell wall biosynthesis
MNIGFDAKRAYHNNTGLGNYSRTLIHSLNDYFPENEYYLFNPKESGKYKISGTHIHQILPQSPIEKKLNSLWRSNWVKRKFDDLSLNLYHGLSHEIPYGISNKKIKSVVTIHDLIYLRYPEQFKFIDRNVYDFKFRYACKYADHIIAISEQTKQDIIRYFKIPDDKITVCYQSCDPVFSVEVNDAKKNMIREKLNLPERYFLYVGSIIERKNLLNICQAIKLNSNKSKVPLVVIGEGKSYKEKVKHFLTNNQLTNDVIFLSENEVAKMLNFTMPEIFLPAIYQMSLALIYPSFFEGFGIPVLEALCSNTPVITSNISSLPEAGGNGSIYVNPSSVEEIAAAMNSIATEAINLTLMKDLGLKHAGQFTQQKCAQQLMNVYQKLC